MYDYIIVGAGLFGAVFAHEAHTAGKKCLVVEKRPHIGGNVYTSEIEGIQVHSYGPHIFHTDNKEIWDYVNRFAEFNSFINCPIAIYRDELYNMPFNMNTFSKLWGIKTPKAAQAIINAQIKTAGIEEPKNLEEQAISLVGTDIFKKLIKGYTEKQWGKPCTELPSFIIKRLPLRFTYNNNYFNDRYQGIPIGGYTALIEKLLKGITVITGTDFLEKRHEFIGIAEKVVYTGMIDAYFDYCYGELEYRSLRFETEILEAENYQGNAVVNYTDFSVPYTRIIEHKHFEYGQGKGTVITKEYPANWKHGDEPYYPMNDEKNNKLYSEYTEMAKEYPNILFGGRLGQYKYYNMDQVVWAALDMSRVQ